MSEKTAAKEKFNSAFLKFCETVLQQDTSFTSIRCVVTRKTGNESAGWDIGTGCYYSFLGKIREIMIMDDERTRESTRRNEYDEENDDDTQNETQSP